MEDWIEKGGTSIVRPTPLARPPSTRQLGFGFGLGKLGGEASEPTNHLRLNTLATPSNSDSKALRVAPFGVWCFCLSGRSCAARVSVVTARQAVFPVSSPTGLGLPSLLSSPCCHIHSRRLDQSSFIFYPIDGLCCTHVLPPATSPRIRTPLRLPVEGSPPFLPLPHPASQDKQFYCNLNSLPDSAR